MLVLPTHENGLEQNAQRLIQLQQLARENERKKAALDEFEYVSLHDNEIAKQEGGKRRILDARYNLQKALKGIYSHADANEIIGLFERAILNLAAV